MRFSHWVACCLPEAKPRDGKTQNLEIPEVRHRWWSTKLPTLHVLLSIFFLSVCLCAGTTEERQSFFFFFWLWLLPFCPLCLVLSTGEKKLCVAIRMGCCRFLIASFGFLIVWSCGPAVVEKMNMVRKDEMETSTWKVLWRRQVVFCYESIIGLSCSSIVAAAIRHPSHRGVAFSPSSSRSTYRHFVAKVYQIVG